MRRCLPRSWSKTFILLAFLSGGLLISAQPTLLYSAGFERAEGYDPELTLIGQGGWVGFGTGGNGLVTNFFAGLGQQAFIGYTPPEDTNSSFLSVFRPINLAPISAKNPVVKFTVTMQVAASSSNNPSGDDFRWSIYNTNGNRLFSLSFDNTSRLISYLLDDDAGFVSADAKFDNEGLYDLVIFMNFARNVWTATLNDLVIVSSKAITTTKAPLNLGDIDAVWSLRNPASAGDNYMLFDNYSVMVESGTSIPTRLEVLPGNVGGAFKILVHGEGGLSYRIEASADFRSWTELLTFTGPANGVLEFHDNAAPSFARRFYRVRQMP